MARGLQGRRGGGVERAGRQWRAGWLRDPRDGAAPPSPFPVPFPSPPSRSPPARSPHRACASPLPPRLPIWQSASLPPTRTRALPPQRCCSMAHYLAAASAARGGAAGRREGARRARRCGGEARRRRNGALPAGYSTCVRETGRHGAGSEHSPTAAILPGYRAGPLRPIGTLLRGGAANGRGRGERRANGGARQVRRRAAQHRPIKHPARGAPQPIGWWHRGPAVGGRRERHSQLEERRAARRFVIGQRCRADEPISSSSWRQFSANQRRRWRGGRGALRRGLGGKMAGLGSPPSPARTARAPLTSLRPVRPAPGSPHTSAGAARASLTSLTLAGSRSGAARAALTPLCSRHSCC